MSKSITFNLYSKILMVLSLVVVISLVSSCSDDEDDNNAVVVPKNTTTEYNTPKYIFFFIGDGMAGPQINLTEAALNDPDFRKAKSIGIGTMNLHQFPVAGVSQTYAEDRYITGSAASATALATGYKTTINTISKNGDRTQNLKTMAEMARDKGMKVGIVSSVSIDHATPACFYAHEDTRKNMNNIALQMADSKFDYFGGGNAAGSEGVESKMTQNGYTITRNRAELNALQPGQKAWSFTEVDASSALLYEIDRPEDHISLAEFTEKGIELLDNENGFFMMVEGGKIDWACHANDAVSAAYDMVAFDEALGKAIEFYNAHPDETLIVVTGDHECGGLALGYAATGYSTAFEILKYQTMSYEAFTEKVLQWKDAANMTFDNALEEMKMAFGLGDASKNPILELTENEMKLLEEAFTKSMTGETAYNDEELAVIYGYYDPFTVTITHIMNNKAGIDWTSYSHTAVPVPVFALGQGQYDFTGYYDNTDIAKKIMKIGKLNP